MNLQLASFRNKLNNLHLGRATKGKKKWKRVTRRELGCSSDRTNKSRNPRVSGPPTERPQQLFLKSAGFRRRPRQPI